MPLSSLCRDFSLMFGPCQVFVLVYPRRTMYTIRQAATRTGISIELLRAWERRYQVVSPVRTAGGYRLYDEPALERLRAMRRLVDAGWSPSVAAAAILNGEVATTSDERDDAKPAGAGANRPPSGAGDGRPEDVLIERFVDGAIRLDGPALEATLDGMFATGSFEAVADALLLPALVAIGDAWADGRLGVAGEHAASHAMLRRLSAAFQAAGRPTPTRGAILVGLPPGGRHELAALAFSVAARRAGLPILYLGPDLPVDDWVATAPRTHARAAVIASPTSGRLRASCRSRQSSSESPIPTCRSRSAGDSAEQARDALRGSPRIIVLPDRHDGPRSTHPAAALELRARVSLTGARAVHGQRPRARRRVVDDPRQVGARTAARGRRRRGSPPALAPSVGRSRRPGRGAAPGGSG